MICSFKKKKNTDICKQFLFLENIFFFDNMNKSVAYILILKNETKLVCVYLIRDCLSKNKIIIDIRDQLAI